MSLSSVNLGDSQIVRFDDSGRSAAYFCRRSPVKVDSDLITELKDAAQRIGGKNLRLCLHDGPDAPFHEMINLEHRENYYRPHKHSKKEESYHIIEGSLAAFIFDQDGNVIDSNILEPKGSFLYRVGINMYHAVMPLSDLVIYHESKPGPFLTPGDSVFPDWAPDGADQGEVINYVSKLEKLLETGNG